MSHRLFLLVLDVCCQLAFAGRASSHTVEVHSDHFQQYEPSAVSRKKDIKQVSVAEAWTFLWTDLLGIESFVVDFNNKLKGVNRIHDAACFEAQGTEFGWLNEEWDAKIKESGEPKDAYQDHRYITERFWRNIMRLASTDETLIAALHKIKLASRTYPKFRRILEDDSQFTVIIPCFFKAFNYDFFRLRFQFTQASSFFSSPSKLRLVLEATRFTVSGQERNDIVDRIFTRDKRIELDIWDELLVVDTFEDNFPFRPPKA